MYMTYELTLSVMTSLTLAASAPASCPAKLVPRLAPLNPTAPCVRDTPQSRQS